MEKKIEFENSDGLTLRGFVNEPKNYKGIAIVYLHGFPGNCNGSTAPRVCRSLEKFGYLVLRFDFSGTRISDGKFEDKLMSKEVKDVKYAINFLVKNYKFKKLILIGHSTGAIDAALYVSKDKRINKLILLGGVSYLNETVRYDFSDEQVRDFWTKGYIVYKSPGKWYHKKKLKKAFYDEFFKLNIPKSLKKFRKPILIIHGEKDEAIPVGKDPRELYKIALKPKKLVIIRDADHGFSRPKYLRQVISHIDKFIKNR